jgi:hypothetical protein
MLASLDAPSHCLSLRRPARVKLYPHDQTTGSADERTSARRRLAAPFALDGAYGAPWQRMSYRTTNVRNPV